MPFEVSDVRSNPADQIRHAAIVLRRSKPRRDVFSAICRGKKKAKTVSELHSMTGLPEIRVYQEAGNLADNQIVERTRAKTGKRTEIAYRKDPFFCRNKEKILSLAIHKKKLAKLATKVTPHTTEGQIRVSFPKKMINVKRVDVDSIESFSRVKRIHSADNSSISIYERRMKKGLSKILGEKGIFQDWGGEMDDLFSTRIRMNGKRFAVALGLKGRGTSGILVPKKMGTRGDQIQRLFRSPADIFLVQYNGQIDESILEQMHAFAITKSVLEGKRIYYGIIDGQDSQRLIAAYPAAFR